MSSVTFGQSVSLAGWTTALFLIGATAACLWPRFPLARSKQALSPPKPTSDSTPSPRRGVHLYQVNPDKNEADTDIDIIAIHGLDTKSPDTWTWVNPRDPSESVNWLADPRMLPSKVGAARIFTFDWPADLLQPSDLVQKTIEEYALLLLDGIHRALFATHTARGESRPVFFIASCLGGIVLAKALVVANADEEYRALRRATSGIVFLATPFRGTSFQDVAAWAVPALNTKALFRGREASSLLDKAKGSTFDLGLVVREFTKLCQDKHHPCRVFTFYEKGKTSLPLKILGAWVPQWLRQEKQLVDESSATLDIVRYPLPLDRHHVLANKFGGPECADYKIVAGKIQEFLAEIRNGTLLAQADNWICTHHYTAKTLAIERLAGTALPMGQCYINLAVIEQQTPDRSEKRSERELTTQSSPFSLSARLKVETLDKNVRVELPALFDPRKRGHVETNPRRILIRGRPGVGKTTLCKKIVYEFTRGSWSSWSELFDRILWVPLRRLKRSERLRQPGYNFFHLLNHEYFSPNGKKCFAQALSDALGATKSSRTLFLLDGLDEVSQDIRHECDMFRFFTELLNQPNVIITARPSGELPLGLAAIDIELETIGFYPNQVDKYLEQVLPEQANEVQSFLRDHPLVQDLVRIPIQLDALCFTWSKSFPKGKFGSMTTIYRAIEEGLWKKDILRLEKNHARRTVTEALIQHSDCSEIKILVKDEVYYLESFAFAGLHNNIIDFESKHRGIIFEHLEPPTTIFPSKTLPCLSFLRTSDLSSEQPNRSYHFLHLTYQEYFAARYFVRQWQAEKPLSCPVFTTGECQKIGTCNFLRKHKYTARYDVFWRFVAGLLDAEGMGEEFFTAIEDKPRDLLGPTHQRLVMHCLSEAPTEMPLRRSLENELKEWLLFEYKFTGQARLASEVEFPEGALLNALQEEPGVRMAILKSLAKRPTFPSNIVDQIASWLKNGEDKDIKREVLQVLQHSQTGQGLSDNLLTSVMELALLEDEDKSIRHAALGVLEAQPSLPDERLTAVIALLEDEDKSIRHSALDILGAQPSLSDKHLTAVVALLKDKDPDIRSRALWVLRAQPSLSDEHLAAVMALLKDKDSNVRSGSLGVLRVQPSLSDKHFTAVLALLKDKDSDVRSSALWVLQAQPSLSDERLTAVIALLKDKELNVRSSALEVLRTQPSLSDKHLTAVVALLQDKDSDVRSSALWVLRAQPSLSDERLTGVIAPYKDEDGFLKPTALEVLRAQPSLSDKHLAAVMALLKDKDSNVRSSALGVLGAQPSLSDKRVAAVISLFEDENWHVRYTALEVLRVQPSLSDKRLAAVIAPLEDKNWHVRSTALKVLRVQPSLSGKYLTAIMALCKDEDPEIRLIALNTLRAQPSLSEERLTAVITLLEDKNRHVRFAAMEALRAQPSLSNEHLAAVMVLLEDKDWNVRYGALKILRAEPSLFNKYLAALMVLLEDKNSLIKDTAWGILKAQPSLSHECLTAVSLLLESEKLGPLAEDVLRVHKEFYSALFNDPSVRSLLKFFLRRSFQEQWSWYIEDGMSYVNGPDGVRNVGINDMEIFRHLVMRSWPPGIPLEKEKIW